MKRRVRVGQLRADKVGHFTADSPSAALESHHKKLEWGRVHYYDKSEGSFFLNPWLKPKEFEYQREFRLYFAMKETKAKVLQIGSIEDIACAYHISLRGA